MDSRGSRGSRRRWRSRRRRRRRGRRSRRGPRGGAVGPIDPQDRDGSVDEGVGVGRHDDPRRGGQPAADGDVRLPGAPGQLRRAEVGEGTLDQLDELIAEPAGVGDGRLGLLGRHGAMADVRRQVRPQADERPGVRVRGVEDQPLARQARPLGDAPGDLVGDDGGLEPDQVGRDDHGPAPVRILQGEGLGVQFVIHAGGGPLAVVAQQHHRAVGRDLHRGHSGLPAWPVAGRRPRDGEDAGQHCEPGDGLERWHLLHGAIPPS